MREIDEIASSFLEKNGFIYKRLSWYRQTNDFLQIISFQKSSFGNQYYVNIGESFISNVFSLCSKRLPPESQFQLRARASQLFNKESFACLDFDNDYQQDKRIEQIGIICDKCLLFLQSINSVKSFLANYPNHKKDIFEKVMITKAFFDLLELYIELPKGC